MIHLSGEAPSLFGPRGLQRVEALGVPFLYWPGFASRLTVAGLVEETEPEGRTFSPPGAKSTVPIPRLERWIAEHGRPYKYSGATYEARQPGILVQSLIQSVGGICLEHGWPVVDSAFVNLYRDGSDSIGWHRDDVEAMGDPGRSVVASVSVGARRRFSVRARAFRGGGIVLTADLGGGDLLIMGPGAQLHMEHKIFKTITPVGPRVSVTLRATSPEQR